MVNAFASPAIFGRPTRPPRGLGFEPLRRAIEDVETAVCRLQEAGGGLVLLAYPEAWEAGAVVVLAALYTRLRQQRQPVALWRPALETEPPMGMTGPGVLLVHQLPRAAGILDLLEAAAPRGLVVVGTGVREEWERVRVTVPFLFTGLTGEPAGDAIARPSPPALTDLQTRAVGLVALFDAWGVPLPFGLLARALETTEEEAGEAVEEAAALGLLAWVELERPPALLVATADPGAAWGLARLWEPLAEDQLAARYAGVIGRVDPQAKGERYTVLKLFQGFLSHRWEEARREWLLGADRREWIRRLMRWVEPPLQAIWQQGDAIEALLWGRVFQELGEFARAEQILAAALARDPHNPFLLHARARTLAAWAEVDPDQRERADALFAALASGPLRDNPYLWQTWGVMKARLGRFEEARRYLDQALQVATREREVVYSLVARADLEIEAGQYAAAATYLERAAALAVSSPYVLHLRGKLAFYEGRYREAEEILAELLRLDPANLAALTTLGTMALRRGHWQRARAFLEQALRVDRENSLALHALAQVWAEQGQLAAEEGAVETARRHFQRAERLLRWILAREPANRHALVALGSLLRRWLRLEPGRQAAAAAALDQALRLEPHNVYALHARGLLHLEVGDYPAAEACFRQVLARRPHNLPAWLGLAGVCLATGRPDDARAILARVAVPERGPLHERIRGYNSWAETALRAGDLAGALEQARRALAADPANAYTHRLLGRILQQAGRGEEAAAHWEAARHLGMVSDEEHAEEG